MSDSQNLHLRLYHALYRIRKVEEDIAHVYPTDKIKSPVHLSIGQESVSVGVCEALLPQDIVFGTYRGHALYLAKGGNLNQLMAELYGKDTGCARGKGGSMHLVNVQAGVMTTSAVVATTIPQAVGYAYAAKLRREPLVVVSFFGDGATEEGVFYESLNFAAIKKLPVLFICENNRYSIHAHQRDRQPLNICERASACGVPAHRIEDNDVLEIYRRSSEAITEIRRGDQGPQFLECMTYRWREHVGPREDFHRGYRSREEASLWIENDQVTRIGDLLDPESRRRIEADVEAELRASVKFAEESPFPADDELLRDVFKEAT